MGLREYLIKRIFFLIPVILGVTLITFTISRIIPSDPVLTWAGGTSTSVLPTATLEQLRKAFHLNEPIYVQYYYYLADLTRGSLGSSPILMRPVVDIMVDYLPNTLELTIVSTMLTVLVGIPIGILAAIKQDRLQDHAGRLFALFGICVPSFWLGIMLQLVLYYYLGIFSEPIGRVSPAIIIHHPITKITGFILLDTLVTGNWPAFFNALEHMIMPAITLSATVTGLILRLTRSSMLEVLRMDYVRTARSMGLRERIVIYRHALRNALIPPVTSLGWTIAMQLGGAPLVEVVFSWPGIGFQVVKAIETLDFPLIMGFTLLSGVIFSVSNLAVDILYSVIDPRIVR